MIFDMITAPSGHLIDQAAAIHESWFTVDTANMPQVYEWLAHNPYTDTYAMHQGRVLGFFNVLPLTRECGELFERQEIREEDLGVEHILPHEALAHAPYAYIAAIAVEKSNDYLHKQCAAALIGCMADLLLNGYGQGALLKVFANPTTFHGNRLVRKLGLKPVTAHKRVLKENDIYTAEMNAETLGGFEKLSRRYGRFVGENPWGKPGRKTKSF